MTANSGDQAGNHGRLLPARDYLSLKSSFRRLVDTVGTARACAAITRADEPRISRAGNPAEAMHAAIDVVADLEADTGQPIVTRQLADLSGYILVQKPTPREDRDADTLWVRDIGNLAKEAGDVLSGLGNAIADDGKVDADEARRLRRDVSDAMVLLSVIDQRLRRKEQGE